jgi:ADP-dependent NAD(P)H-hydrate dehydratase / NAD(P)H-hydrate epimerase
MSKRIPTITQKQVASFLKPRPQDSHKGQFGTVLVIGGAYGMVGAALLAGRAALKLGAGCVHVGLLADDTPAVDMVQPELMLHRAADILNIFGKRPLPKPSPGGRRALLPSDKTTSHSTRSSKDEDQVAGYPTGGGIEGGGSVLAIGCGMGTSIPAQKLLFDTLRRDTALVLDADALNLLARHPDLQDDLRARKAATVITPHPGEAARLLGMTTTEVQAARTESAQQLAEKLHCTVVLKGADSVCVTRNGKTYLNKTGNPGMSAPGMGDVLTGMIAAFIAQGLDADRALLLAVHLHGAAGDALAEKGIAIGMTATELTEWARWLINQWQSQ